mgnify:CR=1 FL=1
MWNVLLGVIGVVIFIGLALAGALFLGPKITNSGEEAKTAVYINESTQIARALEAYAIDNGRFPIVDGVEPVTMLVSEGYLKKRPPGGRSPWIWSAESNAILTEAGQTNEEGMRLCVIARKRAGIEDPENVKACDGSDGDLARFDPCCTM